MLSQYVVARCEMDEILGKTYDLVDSENLEDYFILIGLGYFARKVALTLTQSVRLTCTEDGAYKFEFMSPLTNSEFVFTPGEEFDEVRADGTKMKSIITIEDNVMTHQQTDVQCRTYKHVREFYVDKMVTVTTGEGLDKVVKRFYEVR